MYEFIGRLHYSANKYTPGIISLRAPSLGLRILETKDEASITEEETEKFFISLVEKITSLKEPFVMTDDYEICKNCNFRGICNR
jgi:hypothetical protein